MPFADDSFDFIVSVSVLTHLDEASQRQWLQELRRVARPGAILMLTIHGKPIMGLSRLHTSTINKIDDLGFVVLGDNHDLDDVMGTNDHYLNVAHSYKYIRREWGKYFSVLDIVPALAANQDTVILKNDK